MTSIYVYELVFFTLLLGLPILIETNLHAQLANRESMIVNCVKYWSCNKLSLALFLLAIVAANLYPTYLAFIIGAYLLTGFALYTYKNIFSYVVFKKEHFPKKYLYFAILKPILLLIGTIGLTFFVVALRA